MKERIVHDVSSLSTFGFGAKSGPWWGAMAFIALEGMGFAIAVGAYLYLMTVNQTWPAASQPPTLWPGTVMTAAMLLSIIPNLLTNKAALRSALRPVRVGLIVMSLIGAALLAVRGYEFAHLNTRWDTDAYGSILWFILGLHTVHLATDFGDTVVLTALMFTRHATPRRFSDVTDNAFYWNFVVLAWLPLYVLIYWAPRL
jgi:heme/copper-type cytochrome/quinol oxidase subunit 3